MAINRIELNDFLVFQGDFAADFCSGVNVLIGGNATGKTTLLKTMYWACEVVEERMNTTTSDLKELRTEFSLKNFFGGQSDIVLPDDDDEEFSKLRISELPNGGTTPALKVRVSKSLRIYDFAAESQDEKKELDLWGKSKKNGCNFEIT